MPLAITVGPFPKFVKCEQQEQLLKHFGAVEVQSIPRKKKISPTYIQGRYDSELDCANALKNIHQLKIFGKRLNAKYCDDSLLKKKEAHQENDTRNESKQSSEYRANYIEKIQEYIALLSAVSSKFQVNFPISPKIRYSYPPPSALTVANIANTLVAVPEFYTQVLHLMNKMKLPCPFDRDIPVSAMNDEVRNALKLLLSYFPEGNDIETYGMNLEEGFVEREDSVGDSESELESDDDHPNYSENKPKVLPKRRKSIACIKRIPKLELMKESMLRVGKRKKGDLKSIPEGVFEKPEVYHRKKMAVHVTGSALNSRGSELSASTLDDNVSIGFGKILPVRLDNSEDKKHQFITSEELAQNRVPPSEWPLVPTFKNYSEGLPTARLYIKNLGKTVTEADLKYIFGRFISWEIQEEADKFAIRLMKEGRMKGQAFVTFSSVASATKALSEVNGYILKDKPLVVVFSKIKE